MSRHAILSVGLLLLSGIAWAADAPSRREIRLDDGAREGTVQVTVTDASGRVVSRGTVRSADRTAATSGEESERAEVTPEEVEQLEWVLPETLEYWQHRARLTEAGVRRDESVGGIAMIGARVTGPRVRFAADASPALRAAHEDWDGHGAFVLGVGTGSPADDAGLQPGDVVVKFGGIWIDSYRTLVFVASRSEVDREYEVWHLRDGSVLKTWLMPRDRDSVREPETPRLEPVPG